jgi:protein TonB
VRREVPAVAVATLVLWTCCASVGVAGSLLAYARPSAPRQEPPALQAEPLAVALTHQPVEEPASPSSDFSGAPDAGSQPATVPSPVPVAEPGPGVAFAIPTAGPVRVVSFSEASHRRRGGAVAETAQRGGVGAQTLVFGQGDGRQPAPAYPPRASRQGQEGVVGVRLTVDSAGRVIAAEAAQPCVWPLLNEAAVRTVQERWRFRPGPVRVFDVAIRFRLKK